MMRTILFSSFLLSLLFSSITNALLLWEIADSKLPYIAMVRADPSWGTAVIYNPEICKEIGAACGFFRTHADTHAHLNHLILQPEAYPSLQEDQADCWTAKYGKPEEVYAAFLLFQDDDRISNLNVTITGDPAHRAENIRTCALKTGNWIGD